ncbi:MAG: response regulator, partial [Spongiibacteraceae bacterium]|nr:response regulator [Spongiibacteraceae bacterium]
MFAQNSKYYLDKLLGWHGAGKNVRVHLFKSFMQSQASTTAVSIDALTATTAIVVSNYYHVPHIILFGWIGAMMLFAVIEDRIFNWVNKNEIATKTPEKAAYIIILTIFLFSFANGAAPLLMFPYADGFGKAVIIFIVTFWIILNAYAAIPGISYAQFIPSVGGVLLAFWFYESKLAFSIAAILSAWLYYRLGIVKVYHSLLRQRLEIQNELTHANETKDRFMATMSHELRTPLQGIIGMSRLANNENSNKRLNHFEIIERSAVTLLSMINDILDFSGKTKSIEKQQNINFNAEEIINEIIFENNILLKKSGSNISKEISDRITDNVSGDIIRIKRVLNNLLTNAIKYGLGNPIIIRVDVKDEDTETPENKILLIFEIEDHGAGIPASEQENVFNELVQLTPRPSGMPGTGLGLAICRQLTDKLRGNLALTSDGKSGSTFKFVVPVSARKDKHITKVQNTIPEPETNRKKLLLIEDNDINIEVTVAFLELYGHDVTIAKSGKEGLTKFNDIDFDAILLDIGLPDISGIEVAQKMRTHSSNQKSSIPIIAVTASIFSEDREDYKN